MESKRLLPLSGIAFVVLGLGAVIGLSGSTPDSDASAATISAFYDGHEARQSIAAFVLAASVPFLAFFGIGTAARFWSTREGRTPVWELMLAAGTALAGVGVTITAMVHLTLASAPSEGVSGTGLQALNVADYYTWIVYNTGFGVMMLGAAGCLLTSTESHRRLGWTALPLGICNFIPFADFPALLLTLVWIVVASIVLYRGRREPGYAVAPTTA